MPSFIARTVDGTRIEEDAGLGKGASFSIVQAAERAGALASFEVVHDDGMRQGVDLLTGECWVAGERIGVMRPAEPLRVIYYKRMHADVTSAHDGAPSPTGGVLEFVAVGWQSTVMTDAGPKNVRFGTKVWPSVKHFEVGESL